MPCRPSAKRLSPAPKRRTGPAAQPRGRARAAISARAARLRRWPPAAAEADRDGVERVDLEEVAVLGAEAGGRSRSSARTLRTWPPAPPSSRHHSLRARIARAVAAAAAVGPADRVERLNLRGECHAVRSPGAAPPTSERRPGAGMRGRPGRFAGGTIPAVRGVLPLRGPESARLPAGGRRRAAGSAARQQAPLLQDDARGLQEDARGRGGGSGSRAYCTSRRTRAA